MLGKIIAQLYRIADLLKDKKLVDKDSSDNNDFENMTINDVYQYYKSQSLNNIQDLPQTFDDIKEIINYSEVDKLSVYKISLEKLNYYNFKLANIIFTYIENNTQKYIVIAAPQDDEGGDGR